MKRFAQKHDTKIPTNQMMALNVCLRSLAFYWVGLVTYFKVRIFEIHQGASDYAEITFFLVGSLHIFLDL